MTSKFHNLTHSRNPASLLIMDSSNNSTKASTSTHVGRTPRGSADSSTVDAVVSNVENNQGIEIKYNPRGCDSPLPLDHAPSSASEPISYRLSRRPPTVTYVDASPPRSRPRRSPSTSTRARNVSQPTPVTESNSQVIDLSDYQHLVLLQAHYFDHVQPCRYLARYDIHDIDGSQRHRSNLNKAYANGYWKRKELSAKRSKGKDALVKAHGDNLTEINLVEDDHANVGNSDVIVIDLPMISTDEELSSSRPLVVVSDDPKVVVVEDDAEETFPLSLEIANEEGDIKAHTSVTLSNTKVKCNICLDLVHHITVTFCGHIFCEECILKAIKVSHRCPTCRASITSNDIHPLFF